MRRAGGKALRGDTTHRLSISGRGMRRGNYTVRVVAERLGFVPTATLRATRL